MTYINILGKSRGEIMWDAMQLVRDLTGNDRLLLGCGVPLACAWRNADYCRVGSDVAPWWEGKCLVLYKPSLYSSCDINAIFLQIPSSNTCMCVNVYPQPILLHPP